MTMRDDLLPRISAAFEGRPVRWAGPHAPGDYDGRERTLEVFNADARDQLGLLARFRLLRPEVESVAGGPVIVIFHTTKETARLYAAVNTKHLEERVHLLARRIRELLPEARVELRARADARAPDLIVGLGGRCVQIECDTGAGFDIRLLEQPYADTDPDFRISDPDRASRSVELLISEKAEGARFVADLELVPDRDVASVSTSFGDPPDLKVEDRHATGGNHVRSYMDVTSPDEVFWPHIEPLFLQFIEAHRLTPFPWAAAVGPCLFRLGMERPLARWWRREVGLLYKACVHVRAAAIP